MEPKKVLLVEASCDGVYLEGRWRHRRRRREWYEDGSKSPWQTLECDPLLQQPAGQA
jgi:hypothetical protein